MLKKVHGTALPLLMASILCASGCDDAPLLDPRSTPVSLDPEFGTFGRAVVDFTVGSLDDAYATVVQPDGKILTAGRSVRYDAVSPLPTDFAICRHTSTGALDMEFGSGGKAIIELENGGGAAHSAIFQPDGKILLAGSSGPSSIDQHFTVVRLLRDGTPDLTFGINGVATTDFGGTWDVASSAALQNDGKIIVAGTQMEGMNRRVAVARYRADGSLDPAFGSGGTLTYDFQAGYDCWPAGVAVESDGRIVVAGTTGFDYPIRKAVLILQLLSDGKRDPGFGVDGAVRTEGWSPDASVRANGLAIQADGAIVVVGQVNESLWADGIIVRYDRHGAIDHSFGLDMGNGMTWLQVPNMNAQAYYNTVLDSIAIQSDGKIVLAGRAKAQYPGTDEHLVLERLLPDGREDISFARPGESTPNDASYWSGWFSLFDIGTPDTLPISMALTADDRIVTAGTMIMDGPPWNRDFLIARFR